MEQRILLFRFPHILKAFLSQNPRTTKTQYQTKPSPGNIHIPPVEAGAKAAAEAIRDAQITDFMITGFSMLQIQVVLTPRRERGRSEPGLQESTPRQVHNAHPGAMLRLLKAKDTHSQIIVPANTSALLISGV